MDFCLNDTLKHSIRNSLQIFAVQHVDVCMFSNGKFKNIVAEIDVSKHIGPSESLHGVYSLLPVRGKDKNKPSKKVFLRKNDKILYQFH